MRVCPECKTRYDEEVRKCPFDGRRPLPEEVVAQAPGDSMLGTTVGGRYTVIDRLGSGGMGTVYRAEQAPMGREVALKVLRKDLGRDPETAARFHREARTLSALKHPNTVTIFDFGQTSEGLLFLAMELLEGEMLSSRLKRDGGLEVAQTVKVAAGVLRSLGEAHARGIIHRDLKPDNIYLAKVHGRADEAEVVKVVDFGIAKIRDGEGRIDALQTQEGTVFGTPRYMSPEQAQGKTLDGRSDLYAVGVLLFHMLTGHPPFTDDDAVIVMAHHIKTVPPPVRQVVANKNVPESLERLVQRAMAKDAADRPQDAESFLSELEAIAQEVRITMTLTMTALRTDQHPPPPVVTPVRARRQQAVLVGVGALVALLFAVTVTRVWWAGHATTTQPGVSPLRAPALLALATPPAPALAPAPSPSPAAIEPPLAVPPPPPAPVAVEPPAVEPPPAPFAGLPAVQPSGRPRGGRSGRGRSNPNAPPAQTGRPASPPVAANPGAHDPNSRYPQWRD